MVRLGKCLAPVILALLAGGCAAPLSLISFAGSTVAKTVHNYAEAEKEEAPKRHAAAEANVALAVEYIRLGRYADALEKLERAKQEEPGHAPTYSMFGLLYQQMGDSKQAEANFRKSMQLDPENAEFVNNYGQFLCRQNRYAEAEEAFLKAAKNPVYLTPDVAYSNAGNCAFANHEPAKAGQYFAAALATNPSAPTALIAMSELEYGSGDYVEADGYFQRYLKVAEHTPRSLWLGVRIKQRTGDADGRESYAMLLRNKFPDSPEANLMSKPGGLHEALAMEGSPRTEQPGLLNTFEHFEPPALLTETELLRGVEN